MPHVNSPRLQVQDFTFAQLRTFAVVAQAGSFVRAAKMLGISQPAVSEQIKSLEDCLNRLLFERRRGAQPQLTDEGEDVLRSATSILKACDGLLELHGKIVDKSVELKVSIGPYLRDTCIKPLIPHLYREFPGIEIDLLSPGSYADNLRMIAEGALDLAFSAVPASQELSPLVRLICEVPVLMVAPKGTCEKLRSGRCSLEELQFIFPYRRETSGDGGRGYLLKQGINPHKSPLYIEYADVLGRMVEEGHGVGIVMAPAMADLVNTGRVEKLDVMLPPIKRIVARSPFAPPVTAALEEIFCEVLRVQGSA
jgi:DNA-binding transcriptional LysR family regulator